MFTAQGHHTNAFQVGDQGDQRDQRDRALSAVEPNCWSRRGNGGKRPDFFSHFFNTSKMQNKTKRAAHVNCVGVCACVTSE